MSYGYSTPEHNGLIKRIDRIRDSTFDCTHFYAYTQIAYGFFVISSYMKDRKGFVCKWGLSTHKKYIIRDFIEASSVIEHKKIHLELNIQNLVDQCNNFNHEC